MNTKYCCETMADAVINWGGIWWDDDKKCWKMERFMETYDEFGSVIEKCPWCFSKLSNPESEDE